SINRFGSFTYLYTEALLYKDSVTSCASDKLIFENVLNILIVLELIIIIKTFITLKAEITV
ncbi:hypothetical protein, partial [Kandleria vitulina]|uniref:hypothetical protein n=1 Tax=Kandleria vitulina TaxID=1630 RepID=UPI00331C9FE0